MASLCTCRPGANAIIATQASRGSLPTTAAFRSSRRFMSTRKYAFMPRRTHCQVLRSSAASVPAQTRSYHSSFHPPLPTHEYTNSQTTILSAALEHIPEHGFTKEALTLGARDVGFLDVSVHLFSRQEMDLVLYWLASRRGLLRAKVQNGLFDGQQKSVDEKIKTLVLERLRMNSKIIHHWQDVGSFILKR
jgi:ubiquinone biosynthesis protein COQ9